MRAANSCCKASRVLGLVFRISPISPSNTRGSLWQLNGASSHFTAGILRGECDLMVETVHVNPGRDERPVPAQRPRDGAGWESNQPAFEGAHVW